MHILMWKPPMQGIMVGNKPSPSPFKENITSSIFVYIASMKIKFVYKIKEFFHNVLCLPYHSCNNFQIGW